MGSSVYVILFFIKFVTPPPISGSEDPDDVVSIGESDSQDAVADFPEAVESLFRVAMLLVQQDHTLGIGKGMLRKHKGYAVFLLIQPVLDRIPFKVRPAHTRNDTILD
jgi:hypothetical protein